MLRGRFFHRLIASVLLFGGLLNAQDARRAARAILEQTGFTGGLAVHVDCHNAELTEALRTHDAILVHGLTRDKAQLDAARRRLQQKGTYGPVSLGLLEGDALPYADNLVNLLVIDGGAAIAESEQMRVLAPGGGLCLKRGDTWTVRTKARPDTIDEWTHFLYDATNNAVSHDVEVEEPRRLRWVGAPRWARSHEHQGTLSALVTSGGRIFYIADFGPTASVSLPPAWRLVARDGYSGVVLWERPIDDWVSHLRPFRSGPAHLPRRLVSVGDRVYVTLGFEEPVSVLDAATGKTIRVLEQTAGCSEIVYESGMLYVVAGTLEKPTKPTESGPFRWRPALREKRLLAVDPESGRVVWQGAPRDTAELFPLSLTVASGRVFFHNTSGLVCLDAKTGSERWRTARPVALSRRAWSTPTVVYSDGVVLCADRNAPTQASADAADGTVDWIVTHAGGGAKATITAYSADSGKELWSAPCSEGYNFPPDVFVARGLVWTGRVVRAQDPGFLEGRDLHSGEVTFTRSPDSKYFKIRMGHHRCYRNRATDRFLVLGRAGVEFIDLKTGEGRANHWVRGTCQYGVMPANGQLYVPPHSCACHLDAKLSGFNALDSGAPPGDTDPTDPARLAKGPAFGDLGPDAPLPTPVDWPTFRYNAARSGATPAAVESGGGLGTAWINAPARDVARLTTMTALGDLLLVADREKQTLYALSVGAGTVRWTFTAGGRIDSPPTFYRGRVLCGSADGFLYCLRQTDGALCWHLRLAPENRLVTSYGQLESTWPASGSVLVQDGIAYVAAGRSGFLDGGIHVYGVQPETGKVVLHRVLDSRDPESGGEPANVYGDAESPRTLPDVLSSDGESIFMRHLRLSKADLRVINEPVSHLWSVTGWLDDSWWHRTYWLYGPRYVSGWGGWWQSGNRVPSGRIMSFNESLICGFGRAFMPSGNAGQWYKGEAYRLFATNRDYQTIEPEKGKGKRRGKPTKSLVKTNWSGDAGVDGRAMVLADDTLFVAGAAGVTRLFLDAYQGRKGAVLKAFSAKEGTVMGAWQLPALPVFDGMIAAGGRLFIALVDGRIMSIGAGGEPLPAVEKGTLNPVPTEPQRSDAPSRPKPKLPSAREHADFAHISACRVGDQGKEYRIVSDPKAVGTALRKLNTPLTGRFRLRMRMKDIQGQPGYYGNGFLALADGTKPEDLICCGLRIRIKRLELYQGGPNSNRLFGEEVPVNATGTIEVDLLVDLPTGEVAATVAGVTVKGTIPRPPERITHLGYCLLNSVTDFSAVEVLNP